MLHPVIAHELIREEADSVRLQLGDRFDQIEVESAVAMLKPKAWSGKWLRLDGREYDSKPLRVAVTNAHGAILPGNEWPGSLHHSTHPILSVPFACIRGTYEYHTHPSHTAEVWDQFRYSIRMVHLVRHILRKGGG